MKLVPPRFAAVKRGFQPWQFRGGAVGSIIRIRRDSIIYEVKTIRPLSLPVPIPAQRARKPSQMQQKTNSSHLPPPAGPTGVHPDAVPLILTIPQEYTQQIQARRGEGGWEQKAGRMVFTS